MQIKTIFLALFILCSIFSYAQEVGSEIIIKQGNAVLLYSNDDIDVYQYETIQDGDKYLAVDFINKRDYAIEVNFVGKFTFYSSEDCSICYNDHSEFKDVYTLQLEANKTFSNLSTEEDEKKLSPSNIFHSELFNLSILEKFQIHVNYTNQ